MKMKIAIIGSGNVGGALAKKWVKAGHMVLIGARFPLSEKNIKLATEIGEDRFTTIENAVRQCEIILVSTPAPSTVEVVKSLGDTTGKIIVDAMNIVMGKGPQGYKHTTDAILDNTQTKDVVKCFNTTGANNMQNPNYGSLALDLFVAGDSEKGKAAAIQLAKDAGFAECYHIGGNDKFELMEQFAWFWINLAMFQGQGREIGFKLLKR
ncbi:NADPH-dependent F420 reductase [Flavihumibacter fluvii]|uniref:NADPH-dependent F420 reductase n=1 Tax=Flavihumibacter fluvii TaxID=2838157 RepID=UPI001BDE4C21|nr:NAD(P)-binding domain-containing protein [Flavihumibacter fluvii]ULQ54298.1 NAD(P)-binding domain-containing protein [Flavihumibacter fluvii]